MVEMCFEGVFCLLVFLLVLDVGFFFPPLHHLPLLHAKWQDQEVTETDFLAGTLPSRHIPEDS